MSIITFNNRDKKETGQTLSVASIATLMAIEHNYRILLVSTDFNDKTLEDCFWKNNNNNLAFNLFGKTQTLDISSGLEGLIRTFASNRASSDMIKSYTKPILKNRLDILPSPKTLDFKEYCNSSVYFSQIADVAKSEYDIVLIDLSSKVPIENQNKLLNISDVVVMTLNQSSQSISDFYKLKSENEFFKRNNVILSIGKYNPNSKYTNKNIARYLREKNNPIVVPYNILFADSCSDGNIIDYTLAIQTIKDRSNKDFFFYNNVKETMEMIDFKRQEVNYK